MKTDTLQEKDLTSAAELLDESMIGDRHSNANLFEVIVNSIPRKPKRVLDYFGGIGKDLKVILARWPDVEIEAWEICPRCVQTLKKLAKTLPAGQMKVVKGDSATGLRPNRTDFVCMNFNRFTVLRAMRERWLLKLFDTVFAGRPKYIYLLDSAPAYLHLNWESYGLSDSTVKSYVEEGYDNWLRNYPYKVRSYAHHRRAVHVLIERITGS